VEQEVLKVETDHFSYFKNRLKCLTITLIRIMPEKGCAKGSNNKDTSGKKKDT